MTTFTFYFEAWEAAERFAENYGIETDAYDNTIVKVTLNYQGDPKKFVEKIDLFYFDVLDWESETRYYQDATAFLESSKFVPFN